MKKTKFSSQLLSLISLSVLAVGLNSCGVIPGTSVVKLRSI